MKRKGKKSRPWIIPLVMMPTLTVALAILTAKLMMSGLIQENGVGWCAAVIVGMVSLLTCICSALCAVQKKFLWGMATALTYACLLLMGNLLLFGEGYGNNIITICGASLVGGLLGTLLGAAKRRKIA